MQPALPSPPVSCASHDTLRAPSKRARLLPPRRSRLPAPLPLPRCPYPAAPTPLVRHAALRASPVCALARASGRAQVRATEVGETTLIPVNLAHAGGDAEAVLLAAQRRSASPGRFSFGVVAAGESLKFHARAVDPTTAAFEHHATMVRARASAAVRIARFARAECHHVDRPTSSHPRPPPVILTCCWPLRTRAGW